jgi:hypothetical protein
MASAFTNSASRVIRVSTLLILAPHTCHLGMGLVLGMLLCSLKLLPSNEADELIGLRHSPGRWMAEVLMKLVFAHVLLDYDISLPGEVKHPLRERWSFEDLYIPRVDAKIVLRPRSQEQKV